MGVVSIFWRLLLAAMIAMATPLSCCCAQGLFLPATAKAQSTAAGPATESCCHEPASVAATGSSLAPSHPSHESSLPAKAPVPIKHCTKSIFVSAAEDVLPTTPSVLTGDAGALLHPLLVLDAMLPAFDAFAASHEEALPDPSPPQPRFRLNAQLCVMTT